MDIALIGIFALGYLAITLEHSLKIDIGCFILIEANLSSGSFADFIGIKEENTD